MSRYFFISFFLLSASSYCQSISQKIDSTINSVQVEKTKMLFVKPEGLLVDSTSYRKVSYSVNKKEIKIVLPDYTIRKENASAFWGLVNDFGQCQRFYQGKTYILWHTKAPYVYRDYAASDRKIAYFYSESLVSEIIPLTKESVSEIKDKNTAQQLSAYLKNHELKKSKDGGPSLPPGVQAFSDEEKTILSDFVLFHIQIAWTIAECLMLTAK
ncbi:MAG: hypothetical protein K0R51_1832 [Cytophagaceae bacterium]|jgi:hypothetical protein|nr:hypothetical protein [Cytophagaceae bacterium]